MPGVFIFEMSKASSRVCKITWIFGYLEMVIELFGYSNIVTTRFFKIQKKRTEFITEYRNF
jgi:hypothetical protein